MATSERSLAAVLGDLVGNIQHMVRGEIRLAKAEAAEKLAVFRRGAIWCAVAAVAAVLGLLYALLAAVAGLGLWMPLWAAALIVGISLSVLGAVCAVIGVKSLKVPTLPRTAQSVKESLTWNKT